MRASAETTETTPNRDEQYLSPPLGRWGREALDERFADLACGHSTEHLARAVAQGLEQDDIESFAPVAQDPPEHLVAALGALGDTHHELLSIAAYRCADAHLHLEVSASTGDLWVAACFSSPLGTGAMAPSAAVLTTSEAPQLRWTWADDAPLADALAEALAGLVFVGMHAALELAVFDGPVLA